MYFFLHLKNKSLVITSLQENFKIGHIVCICGWNEELIVGAVV
jgi:hypothetical protein